MNKKTLYIHGLDSSPKKDKLEMIEKFSEVEALHLDYREQPDTFKILSDLIVEKDVTHIIGSSFGGFLGFWLAEKHGIPCLLFNPALAMGAEMKHEENSNHCPRRLVVLGERDDVVDPNVTFSFLKNHPRDKCIERVVWCNELGHRIDTDTFWEFTNYLFQPSVAPGSA